MLNNHDLLWSRCLSVIKDNISEASYNTWFAPITALKYENNIFVLQVPSQFFVEYIEEKYIDLLRMTLYREIGVGTRLEYRVLIDKSSGKGTQIPSTGTQQKTKTVVANPGYISPYNKPQLPEIDPQLNPAYNFNSLIEVLVSVMNLEKIYLIHYSFMVNRVLEKPISLMRLG